MGVDRTGLVHEGGDGCCAKKRTTQNTKHTNTTNPNQNNQPTNKQPTTTNPNTLTGSRKAELLNRVLSNLPPRLHRWLLARFPEPGAWLAARLSFSRAAAAWSMVGHALGLGDRHGENIMIDATCGEVVHVDFGCLFDRGLTLEVPEMVPFRLTQNVADACGVSGVEGGFRRAAEITLAVRSR